MERTLILLLSALFLVAPAQGKVRFTATVAEYELDGARLQQLVFPDGERRIAYTPPHGWKYVGGDSLFILHPPEALAEATIASVPLPGEATFDEETTKALTDEVLTTVPGGATSVALVSQEKNPLMIEKKETLLIIIKYDSHGQSFFRSVMFVNRKGERLRFQLTAPQRAFAALQKAFLSSHYSWQNI